MALAAVSPHKVAREIQTHQMRDLVKKLCATDFLIFQKVELGMEIGPQHRMWWNHIKTKQDIVELAPRDHGKSMSIARAFPLWKVKYDPWVRDVLLLGADQDSAVENLDKIKGLLDSTPSLQHLVPRTRKDNFYSRTEIKLTNGKTIKAKGIGSPLRGRHPQLIVLDDVLNERNSLDKTNRDELKTYFHKVVVPMKDKGMAADWAKGHKSQIVIVGTAQDFEDLYHDLLANPGFIGEKLRAIIDEEKKIVLWPDRYTYDDLASVRRTVGSLVFAQEYQNEPISDETSLFPRPLFDPMKEHQLSYSSTYTGSNPVYMGVDFSVPGSLDGDWTVIFVFEFLEEEKRFRVLNYWRAKPSTMQEQIHQIELWCQKYKVTTGYLEDNMFQKVYANHFTDRSALPLTGHTVTASNKMAKQTGILSFRPLFENERWEFPYRTEADKAKTDLIITEFAGVRQRKGKIGNEQTHDDIVMAMWHAMAASQAGQQFSASWI